jgi:hypothetical protein
MRIAYECSFLLVNCIRIDQDMIWMMKTIGTTMIWCYYSHSGAQIPLRISCTPIYSSQTKARALSLNKWQPGPGWRKPNEARGHVLEQTKAGAIIPHPYNLFLITSHDFSCFDKAPGAVSLSKQRLGPSFLIHTTRFPQLPMISLVSTRPRAVSLSKQRLGLCPSWVSLSFHIHTTCFPQLPIISLVLMRPRVGFKKAKQGLGLCPWANKGQVRVLHECHYHSASIWLVSAASHN